MYILRPLMRLKTKGLVEFVNWRCPGLLNGASCHISDTHYHRDDHCAFCGSILVDTNIYKYDEMDNARGIYCKRKGKELMVETASTTHHSNAYDCADCWAPIFIFLYMNQFYIKATVTKG